MSVKWFLLFEFVSLIASEGEHLFMFTDHFGYSLVKCVDKTCTHFSMGLFYWSDFFLQVDTNPLF